MVAAYSAAESHSFPPNLFLGQCLRTIDVLSASALIVDAASVTRGKPNSEGYIRAATLLGAEPANSLVIEDAPSGVMAGLSAGLSAGMAVWSVNSTTKNDVTREHRRFPRLIDAIEEIVPWQRTP